MINVSQEYKKACSSSERPKSYITAKYGTFNKTIKTEIQNATGNEKDFSNINKLYNDIKSTNYNYISCEPERVRLDNTFYFLSNKLQENTNENIAYWSNVMSNELGNFSQNPQITINFKNNVEFEELTLHFQEVCSSFEVNYILDNNIVKTRSINDNDSLVINTKQEGDIKPNILFNKIEITFKKTKSPYRYIKLNEIDFGQYDIFKDEIVDMNIIDELSIDSSELSANSLTLKIDNTNGKYDVLNPKSKLKELQNQQEITIYHHLRVGNKYQQIPLGTFFVKKFDVSNQSLDIEAYDDTYFMNKIYYGSKFYNNEEIRIILQDLFDYFSYTNYKIDDELNGIKLKGYIPNVEFREALRLIAEAGACVVNKTREGKTYIFKTYDPVTKTFNRNEIFKENPSRNLFNNVIDLVSYNYTEVEQSEVLNVKLKKGNHFVVLNKYPILQDTLTPLETSSYKIVQKYSNACMIEVKSDEAEVVLQATLMNISKTSNYQAQDGVDVEKNEYKIKKIDNPLITSTNANEIANWKLNRNDIKYDFSTPIMPYIEVGDTCEYKTRFNETKTFIPTRLEFSKSILQYVEGE